ncbi:MAG: hypothetical protein ACRDI2_00715, partial [Chloroflexota bacterium]
MDEVDEAQALEQLRAILDRPEFQAQARPIWERWWMAFKEWLYDSIVRLFQSGPAFPSGWAGWLQLAILLASIAAAVVVIAFVLRAIGLSVTREAELRTRAAARSRERSDRLWREGQALAGAARFAEATRALYLSALYALEEHGLLRVQEAQTNREHAERAVRAHPELAETFVRLVQH